MSVRDDEALDSQALDLREGKLQLVLSLRAYRLEAIQKAAYRLAERFATRFDPPTDNDVHVELLFRPNITPQAASEAIRLFFQELLDQELREKVADETRALRALILAQAFSRTDLIERG